MAKIWFVNLAKGMELMKDRNTINPAFCVNFSFCLFLRDGVKKSKWKFKMAFAMKGGEGGLEGVSSATYLF